MSTPRVTRWGDRPTSGRYVYRVGSSWYWQCDLHDRVTVDTAGADLYDTQPEAFSFALAHAEQCEHVNAHARRLGMHR